MRRSMSALAKPLVAIAIVFLCGGATCMPRDPGLSLPPPPPVLIDTPSLADVTAAVNRTAAVNELSSNSTRVQVTSMPQLPTLQANLNLRRDQDFRLQASLPIVLGSGIDLGSNSERFWFEAPEGIRKVLYYARHDQYRAQLQRAVLPVDPTFIMDALGLVQIDPAHVVAGPVVRPDGKIEVRSLIASPGGDYQRVCFIEQPAGYVSQQWLYDPNNTLVAKCTATKHRYYAEVGCALPHEVDLVLAPKSPQPIGLKIDVGMYAINQLLSGDPNLFVMPQTAGEAIDLTRLTPGVPPPTPPSYYSANVRTDTPIRGTKAAVPAHAPTSSR